MITKGTSDALQKVGKGAVEKVSFQNPLQTARNVLDANVSWPVLYKNHKVRFQSVLP